jgi:hypothetical protein
MYQSIELKDLIAIKYQKVQDHELLALLREKSEYINIFHSIWKGNWKQIKTFHNRKISIELILSHLSILFLTFYHFSFSQTNEEFSKFGHSDRVDYKIKNWIYENILFIVGYLMNPLIAGLGKLALGLLKLIYWISFGGVFYVIYLIFMVADDRERFYKKLMLSNLIYVMLIMSWGVLNDQRRIDMNFSTIFESIFILLANHKISG